MPFIIAVNNERSKSQAERLEWARELTLLRQELDEMRANYNAVLAKLDADVGVTDTNYTATLGVAASTVTALAAAPRRFTPT